MLVSEVITEARNHLLDTSGLSGNVFTDNQYLRHVNAAISKLVQSIRQLRHFKVTRDLVTVVSANTMFSDLDTQGAFPDFGEAICIWERQEERNLPITSWTAGLGPTYNIVVSSTAGLTVGQPFWLYGTAQARIQGQFAIQSIPDGTHINFTGPAVPTQPASGSLSFSSFVWNDVYAADYIRDAPQASIPSIVNVSFVNGGIQFQSPQNARQIRMYYQTKSTQVTSTTDLLDIPEAMPLLGLLTAIGMGNAGGMHPDKMAGLMAQVNGSGPVDPGLMVLLRRHYALQEQMTQRVRPVWRPRAAPVLYGTLVRT